MENQGIRQKRTDILCSVAEELLGIFESSIYRLGTPPVIRVVLSLLRDGGVRCGKRTPLYVGTH